MKSGAQFYPSFAPLVDRYDAFILDLWGVIHDGRQLYPGAKKCLEKLRCTGKNIILLSNAPRRAAKVAEALENMGIHASLYDTLITSGEAAYQTLAQPRPSSFYPSGKQYFYIGLEKDRKLLAGLPFEEVPAPEDAQFFVLAHSYYDNQPLFELLPLLERCRSKNLVAFCINPDSEVVRLGGERVYCAGYLAQHYSQMGGQVLYFGKPHPIVYDLALSALKNMPTQRILAVGDNLATDIQGAHNAKIANALVTGGILQELVGAPSSPTYEKACETLFNQENITPDFVIPCFT